MSFDYEIAAGYGAYTIRNNGSYRIMLPAPGGESFRFRWSGAGGVAAAGALVPSYDTDPGRSPITVSMAEGGVRGFSCQRLDRIDLTVSGLPEGGAVTMTYI